MDKKEFAILAAALKTYYPRETLLPNDYAMELWFNQLCDIDFKVAEAALQKWVATNKWSPSIADLREMARGITCGEYPDWGDGWKDVQYAISRYGWYHSKEALESLHGITKRVVERIGFRSLCLSENPEADRANFRTIYLQLAERQKKDDQIPPRLMNLISEIRGTDKMIESKPEA